MAQHKQYVTNMIEDNALACNMVHDRSSQNSSSTHLVCLSIGWWHTKQQHRLRLGVSLEEGTALSYGFGLPA
jgi:hypothetical protein